MSSVPNSVDTVNAAAAAIFTAETRVQPSTVKKRRWGSFLNLRYFCFLGSNKQNNAKRIGHAVLASSEPNPPGARLVSPISDNRSGNNNDNISSTLVMMPFIAPPSSPASFLHSDSPSPADNFASLQANETNTKQIYAVGPYAHETQLVSPPVFSAFTTEPSTASFTPPPEPAQTTPPSPEVPFAQLLSSSLARNRNQRYGEKGLGHYGLQSSSGTSSPFLGCYEYYPSYYKWGSRLGSGSLTPDGGGISRLDSGSLTPNGAGELADQGKVESKVASQENDDISDHRVSFRLFDDDIPVCVVREVSPPSMQHTNSSSRTEDLGERRDLRADGKTLKECNDEEVDRKDRMLSLGSSKDFDFDNAKEGDGDSVEKELTSPRNSWSFFPVLHSGIR